MRKIFLAVFLMFCVNIVVAQTKPTITRDGSVNQTNTIYGDSLSKRSSESTSIKDIKNFDAKIEQYLIISENNDTTYVDTTLTIQKEYKFNYLRRDNFELLPFSNVGQTYNSLSYTYKRDALMPLFGARARHFNYMEIEDINYYEVPTPFTELYYKTAFKQGQQLDAFFTVNTSKQLNFSIAYKGLRSLGKYQHILTSTGNFRFTTSYKTKNNRYFANAHIVMQDLFNEENGGVRDDNLPFFESGDPEFKDRAVLAVNFEDADNILKGKRFHLDQHYYLVKSKDSLAKNMLRINNIISFEDKYYEFNQDAENEFFGEAFQSRGLRDRVTLESFTAELGLNYVNNIIGNVTFNVGYNNYNYGYDKVALIDNNYITNRLKGDIVSVGGQYNKTIRGFKLHAEAGLNVIGDFDGNYISGNMSYKLNDKLSVGAEASHNSRAPNYNYQLYQSVYKNYNWQTNFNNTETQQLGFNINSKLLGMVSANFTTINDYTYFMKEGADDLVKPFQTDQSISYVKVKWEKGFNFLRKFSLYNTIMFQNVQDDGMVFNLPELTTRNTLMYSNRFFKNALFLQTGLTFSYFTNYKMDGYDPLLAEFYVQNNQDYGNFPRFDFFVNAKISQIRIYLKAEHFNSAWTGYDFYSAPNYPYRDFTVRFGVVWNFFL
ncbi:Putative porin [Bizionia echini]|uniref:Putative porin n=1 Tax=Bizionia echini TaxID=649333 RepID=A0A1I5DKN4_9FLAO|nr:putative porin [Bizionia echini]SFN99736.1 Putative porin [Bizionia echini]